MIFFLHLVFLPHIRQSSKPEISTGTVSDINMRVFLRLLYNSTKPLQLQGFCAIIRHYLSLSFCCCLPVSPHCQHRLIISRGSRLDPSRRIRRAVGGMYHRIISYIDRHVSAIADHIAGQLI